MTNIVTRGQAIAQSRLRYFTGKPCAQGHIAQRITQNGNCVVCALAYTNRYRKKNPQKVRTWKRNHLYPAPTRPCPEFCEVPYCTRKATHLDHDHVTRKFRGWTCNRCNVGMGMLGDTFQHVNGAANYLRRTS